MQHMVAANHDPGTLPAELPVPPDDGAARHLAGRAIPARALPATDGSDIDLSALPGRSVVFVYPLTGRPGVDPPPGWDAIPGARGCTAQACSFRDRCHDLRELGVAHLFGLSTQDSGYQREAVLRLGLTFPILSDADLRLTRAVALPFFQVMGMTLLKRMVLVIDASVITKVFYPVFPPGSSAAEVAAWLRETKAASA